MDKAEWTAEDADRLNRELEAAKRECDRLRRALMNSDASPHHPTLKSCEELARISPFLRECAELNWRKSEDYGTVGDWTKERYHPFGHQSYLHMLALKLHRLTEVALKPEADVNFESALDSVIDLVNYASYYGEWMKARAQKKVEAERSVFTRL